MTAEHRVSSEDMSRKPAESFNTPSEV